MRIKVKTLDIIIIFAVAGLTFFAVYMAYMKPKGNAQVLIQGQDAEWVYPIEADATVVVTGPIGDTTVRVRGNRAWVEPRPVIIKLALPRVQFPDRGSGRPVFPIMFW